MGNVVVVLFIIASAFELSGGVGLGVKRVRLLESLVLFCFFDIWQD